MLNHRGGKLYHPHWCTNMNWNGGQEQKTKKNNNFQSGAPAGRLIPIFFWALASGIIVFSSCCERWWHTKCSNGGTKLSKTIILQNVLRREIRAFMATQACLQKRVKGSAVCELQVTFWFLHALRFVPFGYLNASSYMDPFITFPRRWTHLYW